MPEAATMNSVHAVIGWLRTTIHTRNPHSRHMHVRRMATAVEMRRCDCPALCTWFFFFMQLQI